jgi:DNA-binding transcriptional ArsR family regulator
MSVNPNIVHVAALIGDSSRSAMLLSLLGGKALPASELARSARVTPQTASSHLAKMVEGGLLVHESYGRHKYYRLASNEVGYALEALHSIASHKPIRSLRESDQLMVLRYARTCYDHLAGQVGVALTDRLIELGFIQESGKDFVLTDEGRKQFEELGVELKESVKSRRHYARQCLDWSERRNHLAGSLGAMLTRRLFELKWIERLPDGRAVRVTPAGVKGMAEEFGLEIH